MIKQVATYANIDFFSALELPTDLFLLMRKNATLEELQSTQEGRDYLDKCKRLNTTTVDKKALRKRLRKQK